MSTVSIDALIQHAATLGFRAELEPRATLGGDMYAITIERTSDEGSWSVTKTDIALARTLDGAVAQATYALARMAPTLKKHLANLPDALEPEDKLRPTVGVSLDGVVTVLRVERDGSVHLSPDDIQAIAEAVVDLIHAGYEEADGAPGS